MHVQSKSLTASSIRANIRLNIHFFSVAVQFVVRISGEALGSPTGRATSQRLSLRFTSKPPLLPKARPPKSSRDLPTMKFGPWVAYSAAATLKSAVK